MTTTAFHTFEGDLYRDGKTIRKDFSKSFSRIDSGPQLCATLREGDVAWPGCYPMYLMTSDGGVLAFETVRENLKPVIWSIRSKVNDGWRVIGCAINWENGEMTDDHTGKRIPSAYAED